jgi:Ni/Co efflux regulator RcnB
MKTSVIFSAAVLATVGFASVAQAQDWRYLTEREQRQAQRAERQAQRQAERQAQRQYEAERRLAEARAQASVLGNYGGILSGANGCPAGGTPYWSQETGMMSCPATGAPIGAPPQYWRQQNQSGYNYLYNWSAVPGLYAPPAGYQWAQVDNNQYALVNLLNGVIASLMTR